MSRLEAERYIARGWVPVAIPLREKAPRGRDAVGWQKATLQTALARWPKGETNIGILLGDVSGGLVDIDLDCAEAIDLADDFLPASLCFGRASRPRSHRLYTCPGCATEKFIYDTGEKDEKGRAKLATLLELRANAGQTSAGLQTVFPPSTHESGEAIAFEDAGAELLAIAGDDLVLRARQLAAATLLVRSGFERAAAVRAALDLDLGIAEGLPERVAEPLRRWLGGEERPTGEVPQSAPAPVRPLSQSLRDAMDRWNADHRRDYPRHTGECPVCGDKGSFGRLPDDETQWFCFSTDHPDGVGITSRGGHHGDALDLEAHARGCKPVDVLVRDGYYEPKRRERPAPAAAPSQNAPPPTNGATALAPPIPIDRGRRRAYSSNSYLTCVQIIESNDRNVLSGRKLEWNEMTGRVTLDRENVEDTDETRIRSLIERDFTGGFDKSGNPRGMRQSLGDIRAAMSQVAHERSYHPVREYLGGLAWDGIGRLDAVCEDILGAERTMLNQALVRRYLVSAVARAMVPGCKVDTALILVGKTGLGKSSFFRILGSPWFIDTQFADIASPKAFMTLRSAWIYEWAELEVMRRAEDINQVKAWISSPVDDYVAQYGHNSSQVPRSFVVAGTTESDEFLVDEKGNRRFLPLKIAMVDRAALRDQRDQLWAEAMSIYKAWFDAGAKEEDTPWVLSDEESRELDAVHAEHQTSDSWSDVVVTWAESQIGDFTTADVLESAINKPRFQRNRADDMRVAAILRRGGWMLGKKPAGRSRPWVRVKK
jgi:predicted P-loop ATPase